MRAPCVIIQVVTTSWSKQARGGPLATLRNAVPERLPFPATQVAEDQCCLVHHVDYADLHGFTRPDREHIEQHSTLPVVLHDSVGFFFEDTRLHVEFGGLYAPDNRPSILYGYAGFGAPQRSVPREPFALNVGEIGQIRYLGRFSVGEEGYTPYRKRVYTVGWLTDFRASTFTVCTLQHQFASMPNVW